MGIEVRVLRPEEVAGRLDDLAEVLASCVQGGAGVGFVLPFGAGDALAWWRGILPEIEAGGRILIGALAEGRLAGTVQLVPATQQNQPFRADIAKMLVHSAFRRQGLGEALMLAAEQEAKARGRTLLTLDTVTGSAAERLYARLGWKTTGVIPGYAYSPSRTLDSTTIMWKAL